MAIAPVFGAPIKRKEDPRFVTGTGSYVDDVQLPGMTFASVVRSPYAHARIIGVDTSRAKEMPGVLAVWSGKDLEADINPLPMAWAAGGNSGGEVGGIVNNVNSPRVLATDDVKWTGEGVALVIAETREQAEDAAQAIEVSWDPLPSVVDTEGATADGAPQLHENAPKNVAFTWAVGDREGTDAALSDADVVVKQRLVNQRLIPNPMEPRGSIGLWNPGNDEYTIWMASQTPHIQRLLLAAFVLGVPENKIRVIAPDVGGAFGQKIFCYADMALVAWASKQLGGRPVKFTETRRENYQASTHGRDHITYIEVAAKRDGTVTGLRVKTFANMGGRLSTIGPGIPTTLYGRVLSGPYKIPNVFCEVVGTYTNTVFVDAYRGAGRPEATYVLERAMDLVADELGIDPADVRRRNFLPPDAFPYKNPSGLFKSWNGSEIEIDSGDYEPALDKALAIAGYRDIATAKAEAERRGKLLGIGLSTYLEICGVAPSKWIGLVGEGWGAAMWESANIRIHLTGKVVLTIGTSSHGQGHETTMAQIVAHRLGVPVEDVEVEHSDTSGTPFGYGTYGSRSAAVGGMAAIKAADKIKEKAKEIAAHMLEASPGDVVSEDGKYFVRGSPDQSKSLAEVALAAHVGYDLPEGVEPYLDETAYYDTPNCTWPFGAHVAVVEVDRETGEVDLKRFVAVDDCGTRINPMIVAGQIHGGLAQGIGQALWETAVYDDDGQLLTGSMMDYAVPRASWFPMFELDATVTPSPVNPMGVKGVGEAGTIGSTPAVVNAVVDALSPLGIRHVDMPLTPQRVWRAMREAGAGDGAAGNEEAQR
jgi:carbon-monoxide dehydrogenase large subunit